MSNEYECQRKVGQNWSLPKLHGVRYISSYKNYSSWQIELSAKQGSQICLIVLYLLISNFKDILRLTLFPFPGTDCRFQPSKGVNSAQPPKTLQVRQKHLHVAKNKRAKKILPNSCQKLAQPKYSDNTDHLYTMYIFCLKCWLNDIFSVCGSMGTKNVLVQDL